MSSTLSNDCPALSNDCPALSNDCPICMEPIELTNTITTACGHHFHATCLVTNIMKMNRNCPCCREPIIPNDKPSLKDLVKIAKTGDNDCRHIAFVRGFYNFDSLKTMRKSEEYLLFNDFESIYDDVLYNCLAYQLKECDNFNEPTIKLIIDYAISRAETDTKICWEYERKRGIARKRQINKIIRDVKISRDAQTSCDAQTSTATTTSTSTSCASYN
jgi:hypothetical protein